MGVGQEHGLSPLQMGMLEIAVPMWIERLQHSTWEDRKSRRDACLNVIAGDKAEAIACFADGVRGRRGYNAEAFNAVAEALGVLAYLPGGITWCGMHWEATP